MNLYEIKYTMIFDGEEDDTSGQFLKAANKEQAILKFRERCPERKVFGDFVEENRIDCIIEYKKISIDTNKGTLNSL